MVRQSTTLQPADYGRLIAPWLEQAAGYARSILRNRHDAEDAVQQAALKGLERIETFDARHSFKGWFFAILRNCCFDSLRRSKPRQAAAIDEHDRPRPESSDPLRWETLAEALSRLSAEHREILRLRYFGGLSYRELAETLAIPEGTVMSRLHFARKALAEHINPEDV